MEIIIFDLKMLVSVIMSMYIASRIMKIINKEGYEEMKYVVGLYIDLIDAFIGVIIHIILKGIVVIVYAILIIISIIISPIWIVWKLIRIIICIIFNK